MLLGKDWNSFYKFNVYSFMNLQASDHDIHKAIAMLTDPQDHNASYKVSEQAVAALFRLSLVILHLSGAMAQFFFEDVIVLPTWKPA